VGGQRNCAKEWIFLLMTMAATLLTSACGSFGMCGNREVVRVPSPDGTLEAVLFQRDCGATTDFSTQVSIVPTGERLADQGGNAFVADANHDRATRVASGGPHASISWRGARALVVRYHPAARVFHAPAFVEVSTGWFARVKVDLAFEADQ